MLFGKSAGVEALVVFLGNPGEEYAHTRHNAGWDVADALADDLGISIQRLRFRALTQAAALGGRRALLMKPVTYMNLSGEAVGEAARFYKLTPQQVLVVCDDIALPPGKLRLRLKGSSGGHNGLKSIEQHLRSDAYPRLRLGVGGKPFPEYDLVEWVLGRPAGEDKTAVDAAVRRAAQAIPGILERGVERSMAQVNG